MGRGRAKAKQTKVARELKYQSPKTDLDALQRELAGNGRPGVDDSHAHEPQARDPYADYRDDADEDDEEASWSSRR